jgi:hypothetical protein
MPVTTRYAGRNGQVEQPNSPSARPELTAIDPVGEEMTLKPRECGAFFMVCGLRFANVIDHGRP